MSMEERIATGASTLAKTGNGNAVVDVPMREQRDLQTVTAEIRTLQQTAQRMVLEYIIEIGRRLHEAKSMLPHGEWGRWLKEEVSFSQSTAQNFMNIFDAYAADQITIDGAVAKSQALGNLSYTKALRLLALPEEEREEFVQEHDVEAMSSRELERAIREKQDAEQELARQRELLNKAQVKVEYAEQRQLAAERDAQDVRQRLTENEARLAGERADLERIQNEQIELREKLDKAKAAEKKARAALKELQDNPQVAPEVLAKFREEAEAAAKAAAELELKQKTAELQDRAAAAERQAKAAAEEAETMRKALAVASPETAVFKERFERAQGALGELLKIWEQVREKDAGKGEKLGKAILALVESIQRRVNS